MRVTDISEYHINFEISRVECETLEVIAKAAIAGGLLPDDTNLEDVERLQTVFQLAGLAIRGTDYESPKEDQRIRERVRLMAS